MGRHVATGDHTKVEKAMRNIIPAALAFASAFTLAPAHAGFTDGNELGSQHAAFYKYVNVTVRIE